MIVPTLQTLQIALECLEHLGHRVDILVVQRGFRPVAILNPAAFSERHVGFDGWIELALKDGEPLPQDGEQHR